MDRSLVVFFVSIAFGAMIIVLFLRWGRVRPASPQEIQRLAAEQTRRLAAPNFAELAAHFSRPLPASYIELFGRPEHLPDAPFILTRPGTEDTWCVSEVFPADAKSLEDASWVLKDRKSHLPIADSDGNVFYLSLAEASNDDGPVYISYHDGGDQEFLSASLRAFLAWPRTPPPSAA